MATADLATLIDEAKRAYAAAGLDCGKALRPPASAASLTRLARQLKRPLPPELVAVYRVHGGQNYVTPGLTGLFGMHRLYSPAKAAEHYRMSLENCVLDPPRPFPPPADEWGYWNPDLIPFAGWDAYDLCVHAESHDVWEFIPNTGLTRHFPSIAAILREVARTVRAGGEPEVGGRRRMD